MQISCEGTLFTTDKCTTDQIDVDNYNTQLAIKLADVWEIASGEVKKAHHLLIRNYEQQAKQRNFRVGHRVMVYIPHEQSGKEHILARHYSGPYRIL